MNSDLEPGTKFGGIRSSGGGDDRHVCASTCKLYRNMSAFYLFILGNFIPAFGGMGVNEEGHNTAKGTKTFSIKFDCTQ